MEKDIIAELTSDHREVEQIFGRMTALPSGHPDRKRLMEEVTIELVRHSVAEEEYLYPAVREHINGGDALADKEIADHARVEETLKELEGRDADDPRFDQLFLALKTEVTSHVQDEEGNLFPKLMATCSQEALDSLGNKIRTAKKMAPTRPHPAAPDKPPANKLLAPGAGLVDRVRDFVTGRGKS
ncbi:hemerythrin domain-containing protein [Streptantibioticus rubrisoli]|uniref:Hemerythrin domain-containing protein n=1 Tax=Streptantibioticus rubrisoli TaxID=1387313 RepID=A0ABT1P7T4_9ACTN|nr:hemerythrin domain-containing protein [Streptantibioticus rubrisoli]MCQ4041423.1 hemerythrin domain-containing protein [Streptantibioticus rubrisoli]